jgi:hypothetical protein
LACPPVFFGLCVCVYKMFFQRRPRRLRLASIHAQETGSVAASSRGERRCLSPSALLRLGVEEKKKKDEGRKVLEQCGGV